MNTIDLAILSSTFADLPPLDLIGMRLLRDQPLAIFGQAAIPRETLVGAVTEIVAYTERCAAAARSLAHLTPVPVTSVSIWEYSL